MASIGMLPKEVGVQRDTFPTPLSWGGKACDATQDQIEEITLMEEVLSQMDISPKTPLRFLQLSKFPSIFSQLPKH